MSGTEVAFAVLSPVVDGRRCRILAPDFCLSGFVINIAGYTNPAMF